MNNDKITKIPVKDIQVKARLRMVDDRAVDALAADIGSRGLKSPIEVVRRPKGAGYRLVCGGHRLAAFKVLGEEFIPAFVVRGSASALKMAEALENIVRSELTYSERAQSVHVIKTEWKLENPDRTHGGKRTAGVSQVDTDETWTSVVAQRTGWGERTLARSAEIGEKLDAEAARRIFGTDVADSQKELLALIKYSPELQRSIAKVISAGEAKTVAQGAALVAGAPEVAPEPMPIVKQVNRLWSAWENMADEAKKEFILKLKGEGVI